MDHQKKCTKCDQFCNPCNIALGNVKENFDVTLNLAKYIQEFQGVI